MAPEQAKKTELTSEACREQCLDIQRNKEREPITYDRKIKWTPQKEGKLVCLVLRLKAMIANVSRNLSRKDAAQSTP